MVAAGGAVAAGELNVSVEVNADNTVGDSLSAFFSSKLTCQIFVSPSCSLNPGIPVIRIPPNTVQYVSQDSSSVTPVPRKS